MTIFEQVKQELINKGLEQEKAELLTERHQLYINDFMFIGGVNKIELIATSILKEEKELEKAKLIINNHRRNKVGVEFKVDLTEEEQNLTLINNPKMEVETNYFQGKLLISRQKKDFFDFREKQLTTKREARYLQSVEEARQPMFNLFGLRNNGARLQWLYPISQVNKQLPEFISKDENYTFCVIDGSKFECELLLKRSTWEEYVDVIHYAKGRYTDELIKTTAKLLNTANDFRLYDLYGSTGEVQDYEAVGEIKEEAIIAEFETKEELTRWLQENKNIILDI